MRSSYVEPTALGLVLAALMPQNRLVMELTLATGLRVGDVLNLRTEQVRRGRFTVVEQKTGKHKRVYIPKRLQISVLQNAGKLYCFEHRDDWRKHRTRQAVWRDVRRVADFYARSGAVGGHVSPHGARKVYAVEKYRETGSLTATGAALNHSPAHVATTMLYALSDELSAKELRALAGGRAHKKSPAG